MHGKVRRGIREEILNKYRNKKTVVDGITFDSVKEASRYYELKELQESGKISNLKLQPRYELQEAFEHPTHGKQRAVTYVADFEYHKEGEVIVEDVKGMQTDVYKIKKKLFLKKYPELIFKEV